MSIPRTKDVTRFDEGGVATLKEILDKIQRLSINTLGDTMKGPLGFKSYTDTNRPTASDQEAGTAIWNSDDGKLNISDGTDWTLPDGTTT